MKIAATLLMLLVLFLPNTPAQGVTHNGSYPKVPVARFGKGRFPEAGFCILRTGRALLLP